MARPPVKREAKLAYAKAKAEIKALVDAEKKEGLTPYVKKRLTGILDRIDPLEAVAVVGMTFIVHELIVGSEELAGWIGKTTAAPLTSATFNWTKYWLDLLHLEVPKEISPNPELPPPLLEELLPQNAMLWVISFTLAYIIVKNAGALIGLLNQGLLSVVKLLMGVGPVATA